MRKYTVSPVWTARRVTSVEPPGRFFPPTALNISGWASFHAVPIAGSIGGGALTFLETRTFFCCASSGPARSPTATPVLSATARRPDFHERSMVPSLLMRPSMSLRRRGRRRQRSEVRRHVRELLALEGRQRDPLLPGLVIHSPAVVPHSRDQGARRADDVRGREVGGDLAAFA